jgi:hypothetical protein
MLALRRVEVSKRKNKFIVVTLGDGENVRQINGDCAPVIYP